MDQSYFVLGLEVAIVFNPAVSLDHSSNIYKSKITKTKRKRVIRWAVIVLSASKN